MFVVPIVCPFNRGHIERVGASINSLLRRAAATRRQNNPWAPLRTLRVLRYAAWRSAAEPADLLRAHGKDGSRPPSG